MEATRAQAAVFLSVLPDEVTLIESTMIGLNTVSTGLVEGGWLSRTDRVLMTDQERAGATSGWLHYSKLGLIGSVRIHSYSFQFKP